MPALVTLEAYLDTILGGGAEGGFLRITLCGFGPALPCIPGVGNLADAGVPQLLGPQGGTGKISQLLWGNDQIVPANTFYEIAVLDEKKNVVQSGNYQFDQSGGAVTVRLDEAPQILPPYGYQVGRLAYLPCTGAVPGAAYTSPGVIIAVAYNGEFLPVGQAFPVLSYTKLGKAITLNFATEMGDRIDALCLA